MSSPRVLVRLIGVGYRYGGDVALEGIDLELSAGDRLVVLGPNGGGKSTLLGLLLGLRRPSAGRAERVASGSLRVGYVPQFPGFDRNFPLRVRDVVLDGRLSRRRRFGGWRDADRAAVANVLGRLELESLADAYLVELSGGELKRTLIARALVGEPQLLVLDEPTASLDESSRRSLWRLLAELPAETAIVLATHDLAPETFAASRAVLVDGRLEELSQQDLHAHPILCGHRDG